jgi:hypothetical protein
MPRDPDNAFARLPSPRPSPALAIACAAVLAALSPAAAAGDAKVDSGGMHYCGAAEAPYYTLRERPDGHYGATYSSVAEAPASAIVPASGAALFKTADGFKPKVRLIYAVVLDANGKVVSEQPQSVGVTFGPLARQLPVASLALEMVAGKTRSPVAINAFNYDSSALVAGTLYPEGTDPAVLAAPALQGTVLSGNDLMRAILSAKMGPLSLVLKQDGAEVATVALPKFDFDASRERAMAWLVPAAPLLAQGRCP